MIPDPKDPTYVGALIYFNKVAERLSFADAAVDLGVTPSAVSHRIAALEEALGKRLFERETRRIRLTRDGVELARVTREVWDSLRLVTEKLTASQVLRVSVGPYLSSIWLMPELRLFERLNPNVRIDLMHVVGPPERRSVDVSILWADIAPGPPYSDSVRLFDTLCLPVTAPDTVNKSPFWEGDISPIHFRDRKPWRHWLKTSGGPIDFAEQGEILDDPNLVFEAAAHGRGIAIGFMPFVENMIRQGRLITLSEKAVPTERAYWMTVHDRENEQAIQFGQWLIDTARKNVSFSTVDK